jgi:hypothetical protein
VPGLAAHGKPVTHYYTVQNTGGHDLSGVVVTDDRCASVQIASGSPVVRRAGGILTFVCTYTAPGHRKGEKRIKTRVTVTAQAGGQTLTHTETFGTVFLHRNRTCGTFRVRRGGKVTRWKASTTMPDVTCKRVRKHLAACRSRHHVPKRYRCRTFETAIVVTPKGGDGVSYMRAIKA